MRGGMMFFELLFPIVLVFLASAAVTAADATTPSPESAPAGNIGHAKSNNSTGQSYGLATCNVGASGVMTQFFLIIMGTFVFFMQTGFAFLEAGSVGGSCVINILFKNLMDTLIGCTIWFAVGYGFAFGANEHTQFIGTNGFFLFDVTPCNYAHFFFQWTCASTSTTIVSGAMAGRTQLVAYLTYSAVITGFIYPAIVHWSWGAKNPILACGRNLNNTCDGPGFMDFAGSAVVHVCGGCAALVGAVLVGSRGSKTFENTKKKYEIPGHSMPLVMLGTMILVLGFIGFNGGAVGSMVTNDDAANMSLVVINTLMACSGGGMSAIIINRYFVQHWSLPLTCNGAIAGMVSICAGANAVYPWAALVIGIIGGAAMYCWSILLHKMGVDDPIDAVAVHLGAGIWGVLAVPLFGTLNGAESAFYHDSAWAYEMLGWQVVGLLAIVSWTTSWSLLVFGTLKYFGKLRILDDVIDRGVDQVSHGASAYVFEGINLKPSTSQEPDIDHIGGGRNSTATANTLVDQIIRQRPKKSSHHRRLAGDAAGSITTAATLDNSSSAGFSTPTETSFHRSQVEYELSGRSGGGGGGSSRHGRRGEGGGGGGGGGGKRELSNNHTDPQMERDLEIQARRSSKSSPRSTPGFGTPATQVGRSADNRAQRGRSKSESRPGGSSSSRGRSSSSKKSSSKSRTTASSSSKLQISLRQSDRSPRSSQSQHSSGYPGVAIDMTGVTSEV